MIPGRFSSPAARVCLAVALFMTLSCGGAERDVRRGRKLVTEGKLTDAREAFDRAVKRDSSLVDAWTGRGDVALLARAPDVAAKSYEKAASLDPANKAAAVGLARSYRQLQLTNQAMEAYQRAVELAPDDGLPRYELASLYLENNQLAPALPLLEKACQLLPTHGAAWTMWGQAAARAGQDSVAEAAFRHVIEIRPGFAPAYYEQGALLTHLGRVDEAILAYEKALALDATFEPARLNLGVLYAAKGRPEEANQQWSRLIESSRDTMMVHQARQNLLRMKEGNRPKLPGEAGATR